MSTKKKSTAKPKTAKKRSVKSTTHGYSNKEQLEEMKKTVSDMGKLLREEMQKANAFHELLRTKSVNFETGGDVDARHRLKTTTDHFNDIWIGKKTFEIRKADRTFYVGDKIILEETDLYNDVKSGRSIAVRILSVLSDVKFGIMPGYVIFSFTIIYKAR